MTGATIFSGILAPEIASPDIDWRFCAEIEPEPAGVIAYRKPNLPNLGDVTDATFIDRAKSYGPLDILVFGSPCQGFSVAGKRLGLDDPRSNLALRALAIVKALRPTWFLFENVAGLLSSGERRDFGAFLGTVAECGYFGAYRVLDAQFFGVPQRRRRVFFVGHSRDWRSAAAVLFEPQGMPRHYKARSKKGPGSPKPVNASARLRRFWGSLVRAFDEGAQGIGARDIRQGSVTALTANGVGTCGADDNQAQGGHQGAALAYGGNNTSGPIDIATACNAKGGSGRIDFETETVAFNLRGREDGAQAEVSDVASLRAADGGSSRSYVAAPVMEFYPTNRQPDFGNYTDVSPAVKVGSGIGIPSPPGVLMANWAVRRLTPVECERLQGFPDNWTLIPWRNGMMADGPRYKMIGNSMAVPNIKWLLQRIQAVHKIEKTQ